MAQPVIIPEERSPSYLNKQMLTGAKVGAIGALAALAIAPIAGPLGALSAAGAGALFVGCSGAGCVAGKEMIARNIESGRLVRPPSMLNAGTLQGALNGGILTAAAMAVTAATAGSLLIIGVLGAAATVALSYQQGQRHQGVMASEYETAKKRYGALEPGLLGTAVGHAQDLATDVAKGAGDIIKGTANAVMPKVTPQEYEALERRSSQAKETRNWAEMMQELEADRREHESAR